MSIVNLVRGRSFIVNPATPSVALTATPGNARLSVAENVDTSIQPAAASVEVSSMGGESGPAAYNSRIGDGTNFSANVAGSTTAPPENGQSWVYSNARFLQLRSAATVGTYIIHRISWNVSGGTPIAESQARVSQAESVNTAIQPAAGLEILKSIRNESGPADNAWRLNDGTNVTSTAAMASTRSEIPKVSVNARFTDVSSPATAGTYIWHRGGGIFG